MNHNKIHLYTNNILTLVFCCQHMENSRTFKRHVITNTQKNVKSGLHTSKVLQRQDKQEDMEKTQK